MIERRASALNPLVPDLGCFPPAREDIGAPKERVLHVALRDSREKQPALARALRSISEGYAEIDWQAVERQHGADGVWTTLKSCALMLRPTLVFMQIQRPSLFSAEMISDLRRCCAAEVVIANWDGDQHHDALSPERAWFRELGTACDTSLVVNTQHPAVYASWGVRNAGYLQIGIDETLYTPRPATPGTPGVVMLASRYGGYPAYKRRQDIADALEKSLGTGFGVYGSGWSGPSAREFLNQDQEAGVYGGSDVAISMSIRNDLPRYTSDRLFRALSSGAYVAVERFPDMEGLGLVDEVNCEFWTGWSELDDIITRTADPSYAEQARQSDMRNAACQLAQTYHTWAARMPELLYIVDAVRAAR